MALIVEDGSIVAGANSFVSAADARAYALARGVTLSADDAVVEAQLLNAMDYFTLYTDRWKGFIVSDDQDLFYPRSQVDYIGAGGALLYLPEDEIPENLIAAQIQLAMAIHAGIVNLLPTVEPGLPILREKIGPLETEYATPVQVGAFDWNSVSIPIVNLLLKPLLIPGFGLRTIRV